MNDSSQATQTSDQEDASENTPKVVPVTVTISDSGNECSPNPVKVKKNKQTDLVFTFAAGTVGYVFDDPGAITVDPPSDGQFGPSVTSDKGAKATLSDLATQEGSFVYWVHVTHVQSGKHIVFDPTIDNER